MDRDTEQWERRAALTGQTHCGQGQHTYTRAHGSLVCIDCGDTLEVKSCCPHWFYGPAVKAEESDE